MSKTQPDRFANLTFADFRAMALDETLSPSEKIGFPDAYRDGRERVIFADILAKLPRLKTPNQTVLEIGPGCSPLPQYLMDLCQAQGHTLILVDSEEVLSQLPDAPFIRKLPGFYPNLPDLFPAFEGRVDVLLAYSLFHYVFVETSMWAFLDRSLSLLSDGGQMLLGDIPNVSKRKRFFSKPAGIHFHQDYTQDPNSMPEVRFHQVEHDRIDDAVLLAVISRARSQGFDAYLLPQDPALPMANRREDIVIHNP